MPPTITCVCLTTHPKRAKFLPDAIRSYVAQTYANKELLIINDGEPMADIAEGRVVNLQDRGYRWTIGEKRNVGIRLARGEFLATWDDDDISLAHRLSIQMEYATQYNADYVLADRMHIANEEMQIIGDCVRASKPVMPSAMIRRSMAVSVGGYGALDYLEDSAMLESCRLLGRATIMTVPNSNFYVMRRHGANVTLDFGESTDEYAMCGLRGKYERDAQAAVDEIRKIEL